MAARTSKFSSSDRGVRFSFYFDNDVLNWSRKLRDDANPDIPLSFKYRDTDYALNSNSNVRQICKTMAEHNPQASILPAAADYVIESILDASTNETRILCKAS